MTTCTKQATCEHKYGASYGCPACVSRVRREYPEFPLQVTRDQRTKPGPTSVPWAVAERAWAAYSQQYSRDQSVERLAERGGFSWGEMDMYLPGWREATDAWKQLESALSEARASLECKKTEVLVLEGERDRQAADLQKLIEVAHRYGWNGVENAKALWDFFDNALSGEVDIQSPIPVPGLREALEQEIVEWSADRSWCRRCRTETAQTVDSQGARLPKPHQHAPTCPLAADAGEMLAPEHAGQVLVRVAQEAAQLGAEHALQDGYPLRPYRLQDQANGRQVLSVKLNGVRLSLSGRADDSASRHLLTYLFSCKDVRLVVVREGKLAAALGRPAVVEPAPRTGTEVRRG